MALLIRVSVTDVKQQEGAVRIRLVFATGLFFLYEPFVYIQFPNATDDAISRKE